MATLRGVVHGLHQGVLCFRNIVGFLRYVRTGNYVCVYWRQTAVSTPIFAELPAKLLRMCSVEIYENLNSIDLYSFPLLG